MPVTLRNTDILFNDGTTQNTAPSTPISSFTGTGTVGDFMIGFCTISSQVTPGNTVSGSFLFRATSLNMGNTSNPFTFDSPSPVGDFRNRTSAFVLGRATWSPQSGTWRVLSVVGASFQSDSYGSSTNLPQTIAIRIA